jgi:hypothetical protein
MESKTEVPEDLTLQLSADTKVADVHEKVRQHFGWEPVPALERCEPHLKCTWTKQTIKLRFER